MVGNHHFHPFINGWKWGSRSILPTFWDIPATAPIQQRLGIGPVGLSFLNWHWYSNIYVRLCSFQIPSCKLTVRHGKSTISMVFTRKDGIFMGYVSLPEGISLWLVETCTFHFRNTQKIMIGYVCEPDFFSEFAFVIWIMHAHIHAHIYHILFFYTVLYYICVNWQHTHLQLDWTTQHCLICFQGFSWGGAQVTRLRPKEVGNHWHSWVFPEKCADTVDGWNLAPPGMYEAL